MEGTRAEFGRRIDDARAAYAQAWDVATNDHEKAVAAHYVAHLAEPSDALAWNQLALDHALLADPAAVEAMMGSLYVNLGSSFEHAGDAEQARHYYDLAAAAGVVHQPE